jgi:gamma-butyrobetaine dioxygenase
MLDQATKSGCDSLTIIESGAAALFGSGEVSRRVPARWLRMMVLPGEESNSLAPRPTLSTSIPTDVRIRSINYLEDLDAWDVQFEGENMVFQIDRDRLGASSDMLVGEGPEQTPFNSSDQPNRQIDSDTLESPAAVRSFLDSLLRRGYARIRGVKTDEASFFKIAKRLGFDGPQGQLRIKREVLHHDGSEGSSPRFAPHTESPHLDPMPDYHLRLCVETNLKGGDMILVDGLNAVTTIAMESPMGAAELARWPMLFVGDRSSSDRRLIPMLETSIDGSLRRIIFNDRAAIDFACPSDRLAVCTEAYELLSRVVEREGIQNRFRVQTGDLVVIDNRRVLHGALPGTSGTRSLLCSNMDRSQIMATWRRARSGDLD